MSLYEGTIKLCEFVLTLYRNKKPACEICSEEFGMLTRYHICKRCFRAVCNNCSPFKVKSYRADREIRMHRMCKHCHVYSYLLIKYVQYGNLAWAEDSDLVGLWLKQLGQKTNEKKSYPQRKKNGIYVSINQLWASLNYSFRYLVGIIFEKAALRDELIYSSINWGLELIYQINPKVNISEIVVIYLFFLCHGKPDTALTLTLYLLKITAVQKIKVQSFEAALKMTCSYIEAYRIEQFLEDSWDKIESKATINILPVSATLNIINLMFAEKSVIPCHKALVYILSYRKYAVCKFVGKQNLVYLDILRHAHLLNVRTGIRGIPIVCVTYPLAQTKSYKSIVSPSVMTEFYKLQYKNKEQQESIASLKERLFEKYLNYRRKTESKTLSSARRSPSNYFVGEEKPNENHYQIINYLLPQKNAEIDKLREKVSSLENYFIKYRSYLQKNNDKNVKELDSNRTQLQDKDKYIAKLTSYNEALRNMNKLLMLKMKYLSELLMDQEEYEVKQSYIKINEIKEEIMGMNKTEEKDCRIY